jgi:hypothetical protein
MPARTFNVFLLLVLLQGFHELEHVIQVVQRYALGIPNGNGMLGSLVDIEPVHFAYNTLYLALLVAIYLLLGLHRDGPRDHGRLVCGLLTFALVFQSWHEVEHVFKLAQYFALGVNGTGGVFGQGPGALAPRFPIPLLHFAYNTIAYVPALAAFVIMARRPRAEERPVPDAAAART